jgi:tetratricopeptide (TPR) repeat protein
MKQIIWLKHNKVFVVFIIVIGMCSGFFLFKTVVVDSIKFEKSSPKYEEISQIFQNNKKYKEAIAYFKKEVKKNPKNILVRNLLGTAYINERLFKEAKEQFNEAMRLDPTSDVACHGYALAVAYTGDIEQGIELLKQAIRLNEKDPVYYRDLSLLYQKIGDTRKALIWGKKAQAWEDELQQKMPK